MRPNARRPLFDQTKVLISEFNGCYERRARPTDLVLLPSSTVKRVWPARRKLEIVRSVGIHSCPAAALRSRSRVVRKRTGCQIGKERHLLDLPHSVAFKTCGLSYEAKRQGISEILDFMDLNIQGDFQVEISGIPAGPGIAIFNHTFSGIVDWRLKKPSPDSEFSFFRHTPESGLRGGRTCVNGDMVVKQPASIEFLNDTSGQLSGFWNNSVLSVPTDMIGVRPKDGYQTIREDALSNRVASAALSHYFAEANKVPQAELDQSTDLVVNLLKELFLKNNSAILQSADYRKTRRAVLLRHIDDNLCSDRRLSPNYICHRFGLSRSTLYDAFRQLGGLRTYITARRVDSACRELRATPQSQGAVKAAAYKWGFTDPGHFSRLVRQRHGMPPGELLGLDLHVSSEPSPSVNVRGRESGDCNFGDSFKN